MRQFAADLLLSRARQQRCLPLFLPLRRPLVGGPSVQAAGPSENARALRVSEEVREAVASHKPVVALESTIISHGLPYPRNLEVARQLEGLVRSLGAVPATVAVLGGVPCVGITAAELDLLALPESGVLKASSRDLPVVCAQRRHAATTVASTMYLAHQAGVHVFATGGIGGVHRGAEFSMDISADLTELSRTPVTVVSSGVKSILDIPKTLEVLETLGVPVLGFGAKEFPGFYTNHTGVSSPAVVTSAAEVAGIMAWSRRMGMRSGMLVGVPNPSPPADNARIAEAIERAVRLAEQSGVRGNAVTPFVLSAIAKITGGKSVDSNVSLVLNNASIATQIAIEYSKLGNAPSLSAPPLCYSSILGSQSGDLNGAAGVAREKQTGREVNLRRDGPEEPKLGVSEAPPSTVCVVGGMVVDQVSSPEPGVGLVLGTSNPGSTRQSFGGVGRNIAEALAAQLKADGLGSDRVSMVSVVGNDTLGDSIVRHTESLGIDISRVLKMSGDSEYRTASYTAVHDERGELHVAVADMGIFKELSPLLVKEALRDLRQSVKMIVTDGNLTKEAFTQAARASAELRVPLFFEPTSVFKCSLPIHANALAEVDILKPNEDELRQIMASVLDKYSKEFTRESLFALRRALDSPSTGTRDDLSDLILLGGVLHEVMSVNSLQGSLKKKIVYGKHVLLSLGRKGIVWFGPKTLMPVAPNASFIPSAEGSFGLHTHWMHFPAAALPMPRGSAAPVLVTNGAGDAFCGGFVSTLIALHKQAENAYLMQGGRRQSDVVMLREYYVEAIRRGLSTAANKIHKNSFK